MIVYLRRNHQKAATQTELDLNTFKYTKICDHANNIDRILHGFGWETGLDSERPESTSSQGIPLMLRFLPISSKRCYLETM